MPGPLLAEGNCQYTALSTAGTATLNPGQLGQPGVGQQGNQPGSFGVLYGVATVNAGTSFAATLYDVIPPSGLGTNTTTITNTLLVSPGTVGVQAAGIPGVGVRYRGALIAVMSGTPGYLLALWD